MQKITDFICGYPLFIVLIGGGLFLFLYSGALPIRKLGASIKSLGGKSTGEGQISSFQALMTTISGTVGLGSIAGVAVAICMGGPGAIFWMWVSALLGMATKFFEGSLAIMYRKRNENGELRGGTMYAITEGISKKLKPLAVFFAFFGLIGSFSVMQANQLTESITTVITEPLGLETTMAVKFIIGIIIVSIVSAVVLGGLTRVANVATKLVTIMVSAYFILVFVAIIANWKLFPGVFSGIVKSAMNFKAGFGAFAGIAITGARRAMYVNEAGVGNTMLFHSSSTNNEPTKEGLIAMIGPIIDSGLVCTLTAIPILMARNFDVEGVKGLSLVFSAYDKLLPGWGRYALIAMAILFALSTMFSGAELGTKCACYLFGEKRGHWYKYLFLAVLLLSCLISLRLVVTLMDLALAMMAFPTMFAILYLSPKVMAEARRYFSKK